MSDDKLTIRLKILEREYQLKIFPSEEEKIREACKRVNDKIEKFRSMYPSNVESKDLLAMASLQIAIELIEIENHQKNDIGDSIERIAEEVDEFIKINQ